MKNLGTKDAKKIDGLLLIPAAGPASPNLLTFSRINLQFSINRFGWWLKVKIKLSPSINILQY
jgi:hypothetical protein